jgi:hypothetical protein
MGSLDGDHEQNMEREDQPALLDGRSSDVDEADLDPVELSEDEAAVHKDEPEESLDPVLEEHAPTVHDPLQRFPTESQVGQLDQDEPEQHLPAPPEVLDDSHSVPLTPAVAQESMAGSEEKAGRSSRLESEHSYPSPVTPESTSDSGQTIFGVVLVGFDHSLGPVIEFSHPAWLKDDTDLQASLPFLALPDGAHLVSRLFLCSKPHCFCSAADREFFSMGKTILTFTFSYLASPLQPSLVSLATGRSLLTSC